MVNNPFNKVRWGHVGVHLGEGELDFNLEVLERIPNHPALAETVSHEGRNRKDIKIIRNQTKPYTHPYPSPRHQDAKKCRSWIGLPRQWKGDTRWSLANFTLELQISERGLNSAPIAPLTLWKRVLYLFQAVLSRVAGCIMPSKGTPPLKNVFFRVR